jgi:hypothetical protein
MTREEQNTITAVWNNLVLRRRLESDPYSLSEDELMALSANDQIREMIKPISTTAYIKRFLRA